MKLEELLAQTEERRVSHADHHGEIMDALMDISKRLQRLERVMREYLEASLFIREGDEEVEGHTGVKVHTHAALCVGDCAVSAALKVLAEEESK